MNDDSNPEDPFTISDVGPWLIELLLIPGDALVTLLVSYAPGVATFLELDASSRGGVFAIWASILLWPAAIVIVGTVVGAIRELDRRISAWIVGRYRDTLIQLRVARRRIATSLFRNRENEDSVLVEVIDLLQTERAALRCLAGLEDGAIITVDDLATRLDCPKRTVRKVLARLMDLGFIESGEDSLTRRSGHRIATAGQMYLLGA